MFTRMDEGTLADWLVIGKEHVKHQATVVPGLVMDMLTKLKDIQVGFAADQLTHVLMTASLAQADAATDEEVLIALCHDMGKAVSILNHGAIAAEILKPYVSSDAYYAVYHHQAFQGQYYYNHMGKPTDLRDNFKHESWHGLAVKLVDAWDMPAFDPDYPVPSLDSFEPLVQKVFSHPIQGVA